MAQGLTREEQVADTLYIQPDGQAFYTPDGEGRIWFDCDEDALDEVEPAHTVVLDEDAEDF